MCGKHGVSPFEIEDLFRRSVLVGPDVAHSTDEERFRAIGTTAAGRSLFVVFTCRQRGERRLIRPISARYMKRVEIEVHEEAISKTRQ